MRYIIQANAPFPGWVQSVVSDEDIVAYTNGQKLADYLAEKAAAGQPMRVVDLTEIRKIEADYLAGLVTAPTGETEDEWQYGLEVLPPCRWRTVRGVNLFHISERITGDLVTWHARIGDRCFTFNDRAGADMDELAQKVAAAAQLIPAT